MTKSENDQTCWYQHTLFLVLLNIISGIISYLGADLMFHTLLLTGENSYLGVTEFSRAVIIITLIGISLGGTLGYTLWETTDDFPQSRVLLISALWGATLGGIILTFDSTIFTGCGLPFLAVVFTLVIIKSWSQVTSILSAIFFSLLTGIVTATIIPNLLVVCFLAITVYSVTLIYLLKSENERSHQREQRQHLRNDLSAGLLPEGNYVVGDDGELVEVENPQNDHKAQS